MTNYIDGPNLSTIVILYFKYEYDMTESNTQVANDAKKKTEKRMWYKINRVHGMGLSTEFGIAYSPT